MADDPGLNCKILSPFSSERKQHPHQPRPIVLDPSARWAVAEQSKVIQLAKAKQGLGPYVFVGKEVAEVPEERRGLWRLLGGSMFMSI